MAPPLRAFWGVWVVPEVTAGHSSWVPGHPLRLPLQAVTMAPRDLSPPPSNSFSRDTAGSSSRVCRRGHPPHCPWRGPQALEHPPRALSLARGTCRGHLARTRRGGRQASGTAGGAPGGPLAPGRVCLQAWTVRNPSPQPLRSVCCSAAKGLGTSSETPVSWFPAAPRMRGPGNAFPR